MDLDLSPPELFGTPVAELVLGDPRVIYLASIMSLDAYAIRLRADLTQLAPGDEAWVIDPALPRAFGPYTAADQAAAGLITLAGTTGITAAADLFAGADLSAWADSLVSLATSVFLISSTRLIKNGSAR